MNEPQEPDFKNLTSDQAAALLISEGKTSNAEDAAFYQTVEDIGDEFVFDLQESLRNDLKRRMGFDFAVEIRKTKVTVRAVEGKQVSKWMRRPKEWTPKDIEKLVKICLKVKKEWERLNG